MLRFRAACLALSCLLVPLSGVRLLASGPDLSLLQTKFDNIVRAARGEVGVALIHVESGARLAIGGDRRFPMASVYKLPIALELLAQVAEGRQHLDRPVSIGANDIRACCTLSRRHPNGGVTLSAGELLELMIVESDNTASDAVLRLVGGPSVVERRLRALGFTDISVNRYEGDILLEMVGVSQPPPKDQWTLELQRRLISEIPPAIAHEARARYTRDWRDTTTPDEMSRLLARLQLANLLPEAQTDLLLGLLARATTGPARIKGLLPRDTIVAHKTGTTDVVINDVGIITLPDERGHLALAVFVMNGKVSAMQNTIAQLSGAAFEFFTGKPLPKEKITKPRPKQKITKRPVKKRPAPGRRRR